MIINAFIVLLLRADAPGSARDVAAEPISMLKASPADAERFHRGHD